MGPEAICQRENALVQPPVQRFAEVSDFASQSLEKSFAKDRHTPTCFLHSYVDVKCGSKSG